jgi:hypothetical protein
MVTKLNDVKPVLGLFSSEDELRDHIAGKLEMIEDELTLLGKEYSLANPEGAGGRIDILARDGLGHVLCIEVKRSNNSARGTLNELSKYVTLLVARDRIPRHLIRCIVISTHWEELLLPLSYFSQSAGVDVTALQAIRADDGVTLKPVSLTVLSFLPQLSPDMDLIYFDTRKPRDRSIEIIKTRAKRLPFVRLALLSFEREGPTGLGSMQFPMVICVWRVPDGEHDKIEAVIGQVIGSDVPYAARGWEPEADAKDWISHVTYAEVPEFSSSWTHGTPEKVASLLPSYTLSKVDRIGDWPAHELINDDARILEAALARSPGGGMGRANRHQFSVTIRPGMANSWRVSVDAFLEFISFEPVWREQAQAFLEQSIELDTTVQLQAFDQRHIIYAIHQARARGDAALSWFEAVVWKDGKVVEALRGDYAWDGKTCPTSAAATIVSVYGSLIFARLSFMSAVDDARYEIAHQLHGFAPIYGWIKDGAIHRSSGAFPQSIKDFVAAQPVYCAAISAELESVGPFL